MLCFLRKLEKAKTLTKLQATHTSHTYGRGPGIRWIQDINSSLDGSFCFSFLSFLSFFYFFLLFFTFFLLFFYFFFTFFIFYFFLFLISTFFTWDFPGIGMIFFFLVFTVQLKLQIQQKFIKFLVLVYSCFLIFIFQLDCKFSLL